MQTPWSHQAVREEFDEEIRLLTTTMREIANTDRIRQNTDKTAQDESLIERAHLVTLWCTAALYGPWALTPIDTRTIDTQAERFFHELRSAYRPSCENEHTDAEPYEARIITSSAEESLALIEAASYAAILDIDSAYEDLHALLSEHESRWWQPRYGLVMPKPPHCHENATPTRVEQNYQLAVNITAIGTYILAADVTGQRLWADRSRAVAYALTKSLPLETLSTLTPSVFALDHSQRGEYSKAPALGTSLGLTAAFELEDRTAPYFLWVRNLLYMRAYLLECDNAAPEWILHYTWNLYRWAINASWKGCVFLCLW